MDPSKGGRIPRATECDNTFDFVSGTDFATKGRPACSGTIIRGPTIMSKRQHQQGFTLIEIAIVLVIIGLLLGGILKGQELITSARVRNLISQQDGIKAAFYGFQDRYRALPGDYSTAPANLGGAGTISRGNGNGQIESAATADAGTPPSVTDEDKLAWDHLSRAGFLNGNFVYGSAEATPKDRKSVV